MSTFTELWSRAGQQVDDFDPPDGTYPVELAQADAFAGKDGREWAKVVLKVTGGPHAGREFDNFMNLNNEVGVRIARETLAGYGLETGRVENFDDLAVMIGALAGNRAEVAVAHKDGFLNVKVLNGQPAAVGAQVPADQADLLEQPDFAPAPAAHEDDDIPF